MNVSLLKRKILNTGAIGISYIKLLPDWFQLGTKSIVIDCGANVGHISKMLASTGASIVAFEPDPIAFKKLQQRCGSKNNVTLIQKGVWDRNTFLHLYAHKKSTGKETSYTVGSSIIADKMNIDISKTQTIEVVDLISFIQQLNKKVDLVKLDVEGAEIDILKKIIATESWHLFDRMYVETHETKIPSHVEELQAIKKQLAEKGITNIKLNWI